MLTTDHAESQKPVSKKKTGEPLRKALPGGKKTGGFLAELKRAAAEKKALQAAAPAEPVAPEPIPAPAAEPAPIEASVPAEPEPAEPETTAAPITEPAPVETEKTPMDMRRTYTVDELPKEAKDRIRLLPSYRVAVLEALKLCPGIDCNQIAEIIDYPPKSTSALLSIMVPSGAIYRRAVPGANKRTAKIYFLGPDPDPSLAPPPLKRATKAEMDQRARGGWNTEQGEQNDTAEQDEAVAPVLESAPESTPEPAPAPVVAQEPTLANSLTSSLDTLIENLSRSFSAALAEQISARIVKNVAASLIESVREKTTAQLVPALEALLPAQVRQVAEEAIDRATLHSVLIVGLLPDQENMIRTEFADCFRLAFWKEGNPKTLRTLAQNADHIITFTSKISHAHTEAISNAGRKYESIFGGMSMLRARLTELYVAK